jgi:hypothetical protein
VVNYEEEKFPGVVTGHQDEEVEFNCLVQAGQFFRWPTKEDKVMYEKNDILYTIAPPTPTGNRGQLKFDFNF